MKNLFLTLGALLTMGIASAQSNSQGTTNTAGQINKPTTASNSNTLARPADRAISQSTTSQSAVPVGSQNSNAMSNQIPAAGVSSSAGMSTSGTGGGSTVTSSTVSNTANTTNATTTQVPDKRKQ